MVGILEAKIKNKQDWSLFLSFSFLGLQVSILRLVNILSYRDSNSFYFGINFHHLSVTLVALVILLHIPASRTIDRGGVSRGILCICKYRSGNDTQHCCQVPIGYTWQKESLGETDWIFSGHELSWKIRDFNTLEDQNNEDTFVKIGHSLWDFSKEICQSVSLLWEIC